jgi:hypothetical protein
MLFKIPNLNTSHGIPISAVPFHTVTFLVPDEGVKINPFAEFTLFCRKGWPEDKLYKICQVK